MTITANDEGGGKSADGGKVAFLAEQATSRRASQWCDPLYQSGKGHENYDLCRKCQSPSRLLAM
jgi:hypothetical protein